MVRCPDSRLPFYLCSLGVIINSELSREWRSCKSLQITDAGQGVEKRENFYTCCWECKLVQPIWRTVWRFLEKLKMELLYDPAVSPLGMYLEKTKKTAAPQCS